MGTTLGRHHRPHLLEVWGQRLNLQMDDGHLALFRYSDVPGHGRPRRNLLRIARRHHLSAAVGRQPPGEDDGPTDVAVMAVTTDEPVPTSVLEEIVSGDGFFAGRAGSLIG